MQLCTLKVTKLFFWDDLALLNPVFLEHFMHDFLVSLLTLVCDHKCGDHGCLRDNPQLCCHKECRGGCFHLNSPRHCYACKNFRRISDGECVPNCQSDLYEVFILNTVNSLVSDHPSYKTKWSLMGGGRLREKSTK